MNFVLRNKMDGVRQARYLAMAGLVLVSVLLARGYSFAQGRVRTAAVVQTLEAQQLGVAQPLGIAYRPEHDDFVLLGAPGSGGAANGIVVRYDPAANEAHMLVGDAAPALPAGAPRNMAYDPLRQRLLLLDPSTGDLLAATSAADQGSLSVSSRYEMGSLNVQRAGGIAVDPTSGALFILDSAAAKVTEIAADGAGSFESAAALREGRVHEIDLRPLGANGLRGLAFNPGTGRLYVLDASQLTLYEVMRAGEVVAVHDLQHTGLVDPQGMVFAPSSDQTDDSGEFHLMVADPGASPGKVVELTLDPPPAQLAAAAATTPLYLVRRTDTSRWSPPSPDPSGITYDAKRGELIIADGEVDEIKALFTTRQNVFRASLGGALTGAMSTIDFTPEPTGVSYNPANGHFFFSDDDARRIYEVDPGSDGVVGTGDDGVTSFSVTPFGSRDPEDVAYDLVAPGLWIIDGANAEVYHLLPGANGRFDGVAPDGDDVLRQFDTRRLGIIDPEGIFRDPATGNLILTSVDPDNLYEVTTSGSLVNTFDVSAAKAIKLAGVVMAPSSTAAGVTSFYAVDRAVDNNDNSRENDGRLYEFTRDNTAPPTPSPAPTATPPAPTPTPTLTPPPPTSTPPAPTPTVPSTGATSDGVLWLPWVGK